MASVGKGFSDLQPKSPAVATGHLCQPQCGMHGFGIDAILQPHSSGTKAVNGTHRGGMQRRRPSSSRRRCPPKLLRGCRVEKDMQLGTVVPQGWGHGGGSHASCSQELLDHVAWHAVEEEGDHDKEQQGQHDFDDEPLVACADEVFDGLEWVQEPDEGRVRAAAGETNNSSLMPLSWRRDAWPAVQQWT